MQSEAVNKLYNKLVEQKASQLSHEVHSGINHNELTRLSFQYQSILILMLKAASITDNKLILNYTAV